MKIKPEILSWIVARASKVLNLMHWTTGAESSWKIIKPVSVVNIDSAIQMLELYLDTDNIQPLLTALEALKAEPENES